MKRTTVSVATLVFLFSAWSAGAKFAELNYRVVRTLADDDEPARWYEGDYFGKLYAPKAKKAAKGSEQ